jgi:hypothetical protein
LVHKSDPGIGERRIQTGRKGSGIRSGIGDGSFSVSMSSSPSTKVKFIVGPEFKLTQHYRDKAWLESFIAYFECGNLHIRSNENTVDYRCRNLADLNEKIIPFFQKHSILGVKSNDFLDL